MAMRFYLFVGVGASDVLAQSFVYAASRHCTTRHSRQCTVLHGNVGTVDLHRSIFNTGHSTESRPDIFYGLRQCMMHPELEVYES